MEVAAAGQHAGAGTESRRGLRPTSLVVRFCDPQHIAAQSISSAVALSLEMISLIDKADERLASDVEIGHKGPPRVDRTQP